MSTPEDIALFGDISPNINSREFDKFAKDPDLGTVVKTLSKLTPGSSITGEIHILAPTGPFFISVSTVTATAADPIPVPLADRVSLSIRNKGSVTVYFGYSIAVTADDTSTGGWEIGAGEDFNIDLDSSNAFFLITPAATSAIVKIFEIAST